jgi:hypothetical protein
MRRLFPPLFDQLFGKIAVPGDIVPEQVLRSNDCLTLADYPDFAVFEHQLHFIPGFNTEGFAARRGDYYSTIFTYYCLHLVSCHFTVIIPYSVKYGSSSLKHVLPELTDMSYGGMDIGEGNTASLKFREAAFGNAPEKELQKIRTDPL